MCELRAKLQDVPLYERRLARMLYRRHGGGRCQPHVSVRATVADCHLTYSFSFSHGCTVHLMARRSSSPGEHTMYRFIPSVPVASKWIWMLVFTCAGVNATYLIFPHSITLGNKNPDLYISDQCMDSASCRYSTTAATVQILRQSKLFLATTAWEHFLLPLADAREPTICERDRFAFFCTAITRFPRPGDGLLPSPGFFSKITAETSGVYPIS